MEQRVNKTIMCSVLFLDIVAYSKKPVSAQIAQKELFNALLADAIRNTPTNDRIILDTGDGAAVAFLGDIEDALKAVLAFRASLLSEGAVMDPPLQVCMSINLGPARLIKDINGQPNVVGDGINVAQRIMGFAKPGQILVSRSYFEAASHLSQEYADMFYRVGLRTDKHVREHEVYAIYQPGETAATLQASESKSKIAQNKIRIALNKLKIAANQSSARIAQSWLQDAHTTFKYASKQQRALYIGIITSTLALMIVVPVKISRWTETAPQVAVNTRATPFATSAVTETAAPSPSTAEHAAGPYMGRTAPQAAPLSPPMTADNLLKKPQASVPSAPSSAHENERPQLPGSHNKHDSTTKKPHLNRPSTLASVSIAVTPWGEVYVDGKMAGISPPLDVLHVTPGEHKVEIRNTTLPLYSLNIHVKANEQIKIKHKFAN